MSFKKGVSLFTFLSIFTVVQSQHITPYTFNNGGGFTSTMEWSIGESVSIANFAAANYNLNTGLLQPQSNVITSVNELGSVVFGDQITVGPNPASSYLQIKTRFAQSGSLKIQLLNAQLGMVNTIDAGFITGIYDKTILLNQQPIGVYYLKVYYKPIAGPLKKGVYKIIKIQP